MESSPVGMASVSAWWKDATRLFTVQMNQMRETVLFSSSRMDTIRKSLLSKQLIPVKVNISTILKNVIEISEVKHILELKFGISLKWYENWAKYYNLKQKEALNTLSDIELGSIWIIYIIFENTDNDEAVWCNSFCATEK